MAHKARRMGSLVVEVETLKGQSDLSSHPTRKDAGNDDHSEVIITMEHNEVEQPWVMDEEQDSDVSSSSTPNFKTGRHSKTEEMEIVELVKIEAKQQMIKPRNRRGPSMQLLADTRISEWPNNDNLCLVDYHNWTLKQWVSALRAEIVRISCNTVILYLEKTHEYEDVLPLKNALHSICKTIWQHKAGARIFICNILPQVTSSPLRRSMESNFTLLQAVRSVNRALSKVHYLSVYEHFFSSGRIIRPTHQFFQENGQLTRYGCLIFRECLFREAGLKTYWF